jgi:hypothetical protein
MPQQRAQARAEQEEAEHEEDVVQPLGHDVPEAEHEVTAHDLAAAVRGRGLVEGVGRARGALLGEVAPGRVALVEHGEVDRGKGARGAEAERRGVLRHPAFETGGEPEDGGDRGLLGDRRAVVRERHRGRHGLAVEEHAHAALEVLAEVIETLASLFRGQRTQVGGELGRVGAGAGA